MEGRSDTTQKSFWRRKGLKFPGSVSVVPSSAATTVDEAGNVKTQPVIGARYTYTTLLTTTTSNDPPLLPFHHASKPTKSHSTKQTFTMKRIPVPQSPSIPKHRTASSFNAFLKDTNDEWDDTLEDNIPSAQPFTISPHTTSALSKSPSSPPPFSSPSPSPSALLTNRAQAMAPTPSKTRSVSIGGVRDDVKAILEDPSNILQGMSLNDTLDPAKTKKFKEVLSSSNVDLVALRSLSWSGIPKEFRLMAWQLLLGYLPCNSERRVATLKRKRKEYKDGVSNAEGTVRLDEVLLHQIQIDIPRTHPGVALYQYKATQMCLERILYQWAIRHPASGYVQGINDLVTPIFEVFLSAYIVGDPETYDVSKLDADVLAVIEADSFWCLSKLLDGIQDNYTFAQPGIQRQIVTLKELVSRIDGRLASHLQKEGVEFIQFAFRWMNCLLMRELPLKNTIRMWDTYLAEGSAEGFSEFHVYVCAAFLVKWSSQLQQLDFQGVMMLLQNLNEQTKEWQEKDIELLLSEAYMWKTLFHNAPSHLKT